MRDSVRALYASLVMVPAGVMLSIAPLAAIGAAARGDAMLLAAALGCSAAAAAAWGGALWICRSPQLSLQQMLLLLISLATSLALFVRMLGMVR